MRPIVCLDFEASSLGPASWPIGIGAAWISDSVVRVRSSLIRPRPEWTASAWCARSAAVHGIAPDVLATAPTADEVASDFSCLLAGATILSEAPAHDQR